MVALCLVIVPMLFAAESDADVVNKTVGPTNAAPIQLQKSASPRRVPQSRDLLFSQIPSTTANAVACQLDLVYPFEADLVEDVTPTEDWMIDSVVGYVGVWGAWVGWSLVPNVRFLVYADSSIGNHPVDSPFVEIIIDQGTYETAVYGSGYIVGLPLPSPVNLTAGVTYWLEVQPCFSFAANGQSGTMTEVGIGNGQEFFNRFPLLGTTVFTTAATGGWAGQEGGIELYGTTAAPSSILYVDDDDDATLSGYFETSFSNLGIAYDIWVVTDSSDVTPDAAVMGNYDIVVWTTGDDWSSTFVGTDTIEVANYLAGGGKMWLSSEDILYDLGPVSWLHVASYTSDIGCVAATGVGPIMTGTSFTTTGGIVSDYSDEIYPDAFAWTEMQNETPVDNTIAMDPSTGLPYYLFFNAFPFENIDAEADRDTMMSRILSWLSQPPPDHDVASIGFLNPGLIVTPGSEDVIGVVANLGSTDETYDVHCVVTDPSVVLDVTINVTTLVGESDTLNFGPVVFQDGYTYDIMMATLLAGDTNPTNDTLTQSTFCTVIYWEILTDMPYTSSGPYVGYSMDAASNTYVHVFGGNPSAQALHYIYDVTNASWSAGTPLPTGATYGGYCSINNKIYMIGAWTAGPDALITIYDADSDIYTTVALPTGNINDPGIAVKDNNLIYIVGGGPGGWTATTIVNLYDVAGDSFFTNVTQLPAADAKGFAGTAMITGDTIVVAAGYGPSGSEDKVLFGAIDSANPANITWSTGPAYPGGVTYRLSGDSWEGVGYFTCGSSALKSTYAYEAGTGWITLPDKPTGAMNVGFVMAAVDTSLVDDVEGYGFACGGYSPYMSTFEVLHSGVITGIFEQPDDVPVAFTSRMISSNPVADRAQIEFAMPHKGPVTFSIYDISGRRVLNSKYSSISAGTHTILWSCKDDVGRDVPSGIYFYCLEAAGNVATGKLIIVQ